MAAIYFVRHGEYVNPENIVPWRLPHFPLSKKGRADINRDADYFKNIKIEAIYSSPILRAKQSAIILAKRLNKKVVFSKLISEIRTPIQEKHLSYEEFNKQGGYPFLNDFHIKNNGESIDKVFKRVERLVKKVTTKSPNKNFIFVSHGDPIMIFILKKRGIKITGSQNDFEENGYIQKAGIIKYEV